MSIFKRGSEEIEGEIPQFVRRDVAARSNDDEVLAHNVGSLLQRVSVNSVQEIDRLIGDLRVLKQRLEHEGERIQREIRRSEEHTSELQSRQYLVCRLLLE